MWTLKHEVLYNNPVTGETGIWTKIFLFKTEEKRQEWWNDKQALEKGIDEINDAFDHETKKICMSREEFECKGNTWLSNVEEFKQKWGDHMVTSNMESSVNALQRRIHLPITKWPIVHIYASGNVRKLMVFDDQMSMDKWCRESTALKNKLQDFDPDNLSQEVHRNLAYRWMLEVIQFHEEWGHKMVPDLVAPLEKIETALNVPKKGIEAGCWSFAEQVSEGEHLMWFGSFEL